MPRGSVRPRNAGQFSRERKPQDANAWEAVLWRRHGQESQQVLSKRRELGLLHKPSSKAPISREKAS